MFHCTGGEIVLPDRNLVLVSGNDGGNLIVNPPRDVWERSELSPVELMQWSNLVAATGRSMLEELPQLENGCINYWEAGNWSLHTDCDPQGLKTAKEFRKVHLHLLGRSRTAARWKWGEAPKFPDFADRYSWASGNERLSAKECEKILDHVEFLLVMNYGMQPDQISPRIRCSLCGYPSAESTAQIPGLCTECKSGEYSDE